MYLNIYHIPTIVHVAVIYCQSIFIARVSFTNKESSPGITVSGDKLLSQTSLNFSNIPTGMKSIKQTGSVPTFRILTTPKTRRSF